MKIINKILRNHQLVSGFSFGITSGVITSLGMVVGMFSATNSKLAVVAGLITMAIADGLADGAGQHMSEEAESSDGEQVHTQREVWMSTLYTFISVCGSILSFVPFIFIFPLGVAMIWIICWGVLLLVVFNILLAKSLHEKPVKIIAEHLGLTAFVIVASYFVGDLIGKWLS